MKRENRYWPLSPAFGVGALLLAACASTSVPAANPRVKITETPIEGASGPLSPAEVVGASWSRALTQTIWSNRDSHAALVYRDRLWVLGGWGAGPLGDVWSSTDGTTWSRAKDACSGSIRGKALDPRRLGRSARGWHGRSERRLVD